MKWEASLLGHCKKTVFNIKRGRVVAPLLVVVHVLYFCWRWPLYTAVSSQQISQWAASHRELTPGRMVVLHGCKTWRWEAGKRVVRPVDSPLVATDGHGRTAASWCQCEQCRTAADFAQAWYATSRLFASLHPVNASYLIVCRRVKGRK
jgi:hypothetical protein